MVSSIHDADGLVRQCRVRPRRYAGEPTGPSQQVPDHHAERDRHGDAPVHLGGGVRDDRDREHGQDGRPASIVNVSSVHQVIPEPRFVGYSVSKGGMADLTHTLALGWSSE